MDLLSGIGKQVASLSCYGGVPGVWGSNRRRGVVDTDSEVMKRVVSLLGCGVVGRFWYGG